MSYVEHKCAQRTDEWFTLRKKLLVTGSNSGTIAGHCKYKSPQKFLQDYLNNVKVFSNKAMQHGEKYESHAREWYEKKYNVKVVESGILIPNWDTEIGGSLDGFVGDNGIIEIKCPQKMYSFDPTPENPTGMPMYHFDQIQFYLAVTEREWCDYVVYIPTMANIPGQVAVKRVLRNKTYWDDFLYPSIRNFIGLIKSTTGNDSTKKRPHDTPL